MLKYFMPWKHIETETYTKLSQDGNREVKNTFIRNEFYNPKGIYKKRKIFLYQTITDLNTDVSLKRQISRVTLADGSSDYESKEIYTSPVPITITHTRNTFVGKHTISEQYKVNYFYKDSREPFLWQKQAFRDHLPFFSNIETSNTQINTVYTHESNRKDIFYSEKILTSPGVIDFIDIKRVTLPIIPSPTQSSSSPR